MFINSLFTSKSKQLAVVLGGFCFGILLGPLFGWVGFEWMIGAIVVGIVCIIMFGSRRLQPAQISTEQKTRKLKLVATILIFFLLGIFRYSLSNLSSSIVTIADKANQTIRIEGDVSAEVIRSIKGQQVVLDHLTAVDERVEGKLLARLPLYPEVRYQDHLQVSCHIDEPEPFNGFAYDRLLRSRGILAICSFPQFTDVQPSNEVSMVGMLLWFKQFLIDRLHQIVGEPHASFLSGLLFGGGSSLSDDLQTDFSKTGTSHILAASGFNVSLFSVAFLGWILTTKLRRNQALGLAGLMLVIYMLIAGATPAIVRATLMASLILVQHLVRREPSRLNLLLIAASLMLVVNPRILLDDPGFQLSFVATIGILYLVPKWIERFEFLPEVYGLRESFVASLVASLCTLPIILWHFGTISFSAPFVNMLVLPLVPYAMLLTIVGLVAGLIWIPIGRILLLPAWACSVVMLKVIRIFGSIV